MVVKPLSNVLLKVSFVSKQRVVALFVAASLYLVQPSYGTDELPDEVMHHVLTYVDPLDLLYLPQISKHFQKLVESPSLWEHFLEQDDRTGRVSSYKTKVLENIRNPILFTIVNEYEDGTFRLCYDYGELRHLHAHHFCYEGYGEIPRHALSLRKGAKHSFRKNDFHRTHVQKGINGSRFFYFMTDEKRQSSSFVTETTRPYMMPVGGTLILGNDDKICF